MKTHIKSLTLFIAIIIFSSSCGKKMTLQLFQLKTLHPPAPIRTPTVFPEAIKVLEVGMIRLDGKSILDKFLCIVGRIRG